MRINRLMGGALAVLLLSGPALADSGRVSSSWNDVRHALYGERTVAAVESGELTLDVPYRAADDRRVPVRAAIDLPEGETIETLSLIIDENPVPVSAVFEMATERGALEVEVAMRLNGPSHIRAVVETSEGRLLMSEHFVKTSGVGACASPPVTGIEEAIASLGEMKLETGGALAADHSATLDLRHPQHSGMQMNQITLLYIPARYVDTVDVWEDDSKLFTLRGSISLSEDPGIAFSLSDPLPAALRVRMTDTEEATFERRFPLGGA